jgi:ribosomal protein S18 acetylase RimI-like enzyme
VTELNLRAMTDEERERYRTRLEEGYARQMVEFGGMADAEAAVKARRDIERHLPSAGPLDGHHLFTAELAGTAVGWLWLGEQSPEGRAGEGWIFDVEVLPEHRGRGVGRALVLAAVARARELGCSNLGLNVFGGNDVAIRLYQSLGFRTRAMQLSRAL